MWYGYPEESCSGAKEEITRPAGKWTTLGILTFNKVSQTQGGETMGFLTHKI